MPLTDPAGVYRPRHPERTVGYRLFEEHFERYVREYEERYEALEGSLRKVVPTTVEAYLACGRLEGGFARIRCPNCRAEHLLAFSCRTRNFGPSCQAKRSALFAEHVVTEILEPVPHRHVVVTIPRVLHGLFQRERRLLGLLARAARDAIFRSVHAILDRHDATPGLVVSIQTFGSYAANFHPHVHALLTNGAFTEEGEFLQLPYFDARLVEEVFHRRVLQRLHHAERLSEEFLGSLLGWVHSGFSVHGEQTVPTEGVQGAERLARYLTRGPLPIDVVEKVEGGRLRVRTPPDPRTGLVEKILDPLDLIHALTTQIPDPGQHLVRYCGWYSNRSRRARAAVGARLGGAPPQTQPGPPPPRPPAGGPPTATRARPLALARQLGATAEAHLRGRSAPVRGVWVGDEDRLGDHGAQRHRRHPAPPRQDRKTGSVRGARAASSLRERPRARSRIQRETGRPSGPYRRSWLGVSSRRATRARRRFAPAPADA